MVGLLRVTNPQARSITGAARNPACQRRVGLEVVGRAHLGEVAAACGAQATLVPSVIATGRGQRFEAKVLGGSMALLRKAVFKVLGCTIDAADVADLRDVDAADERLRARAVATREWLETRTPGEASLARGAVVSLQLDGLAVMLEVDALVWTGAELVVVEVKSFATIDGTAPGEDVAAAAAQAAVYTYALRALNICHGEVQLDVAPYACLVTTRDFTLKPAVHRVNLAGHLAHIEVTIARLASQVRTAMGGGQPTVTLDMRGLSVPPPPGVHAANRRAIAQLPANLVPGCLGVCPMWEVCRDEARACGDPASYGSSHAERLAGVDSLARVAELAAGAVPDSTETALADALVRTSDLLASATGRPSLRGVA